MPQVQLFPNTYYHIYNRGNNGETIFIEERNYRYFLQLYRNHITPIAETYAYCLLRNHFHFLIRLKDLQGFENLEGLADGRKNSQPFANFFNAYTKAFNKSYNRTGSLFEGRFKRKPVTDDRYFQALVIYIHQNPEKHGLIDDFRDWPYSSYQAITSQKPTQISKGDVLAWFNGKQNFEDFHRQGFDSEIITKIIENDFI